MEGITISEAAAKQIKSIMEIDNTAFGLRIAIAGGGCSGFQYQFELPEAPEADDSIYESFGVKVVVDSISLQYLTGSELDYKQEIMGSRFVLNNPNTVGSCGCGESVQF